jgi:hypothetical protein
MKFRRDIVPLTKSLLVNRRSIDLYQANNELALMLPQIKPRYVALVYRGF